VLENQLEINKILTCCSLSSNSGYNTISGKHLEIRIHITKRVFSMAVICGALCPKRTASLQTNWNFYNKKYTRLILKHITRSILILSDPKPTVPIHIFLRKTKDTPSITAVGHPIK